MSPDWEEPWDVPERPPSSVLSQTTTDDDDDDATDHSLGPSPMPEPLSSEGTLNLNQHYIYLGQLLLEKQQLERVDQQRTIWKCFHGGRTKSFRKTVDHVTFPGIRLTDPVVAERLNSVVCTPTVPRPML